MQSILRLRIAEYFDSLRNQVDLFTETKISENVEQESFWNKRRQDQMDEMEQMETAGLAKASRVRDESIAGEESEIMMMSKLLDGVCFLLEYGCMQFLVKVDRHVDQSEIEYLRKFVKLEKKDYKTIVDFLMNGQGKCYEKVIFGDLVKKMEELLTVDSAVANMSWWFDQEYHIDMLAFVLKLVPKQFDCPLRIRTLDVTIYLPDVDDIVKATQIIQDGFRNATSIVIKLRSAFQHSAKAITSLSSIKWDQRTTPVIHTDLFESENKLDDQVYHKNLMVNLPNVGWFSSVNWGQFYQLEFYYCKAKDLNQVDFSSLRSLRKCIFTGCEFEQVDWSFLDHIRACIKHLEFDSNYQLPSVSWKMFSGMTNLESLKFNERRYTEVDLDAQGQLFADLIQLKSLSLKINERLLEKEWLCELPRLEELDISIVYNPFISTSPAKPAKMRFNLPKLSKLEFSYCSDILNLDLAPALSSLSHVQKLIAPSKYLRKGWFRGFKCSTLECNLAYSTIDSSLFVGLDNLTSINLYYVDGGQFKDDALAALVKLENIRLTVNDNTWLERNMQKFNCLRALKSIYISCQLPYSESLVYFENLDKFILVRKS